MPDQRPAIPAALIRDLMIEVGYRCAICGETSSLEIDHIVEWAKVQKHEFNNMIVLCGTCHGRKVNTGDPRHINRASLEQIKRTLMRSTGDYPIISSDQISSFVSEIDRFSGTCFDVAGTGKNDRAMEYFLYVIEPALANARWLHIDWNWGIDGDTFHMQAPLAMDECRYGVLTGVTNIVVQAAMHGDKNEAADALVSAFNKIGIPATREYAYNTNWNFYAVHILVGPKR
jgi:hypothetical protein